MVRYIILALFLFGFTSCKKDLCCTVIESIVSFSIQNSQNEDLLSSNTIGHINSEDIKLYNVDDDGNTNLILESSSWDNGFKTYQNQDQLTVVKVFLDPPKPLKKLKTLIEWGNYGMDTLEVTYNETPNTLTINKVWINSILKWEDSEPYVPYFTVIK